MLAVPKWTKPVLKTTQYKNDNLTQEKENLFVVEWRHKMLFEIRTMIAGSHA